MSPSLAAGFDAAEIRTIDAAAAIVGADPDTLVTYTYNIARLGDALTVAALVAEYRSANASYVGG